jgi:hypothetical protein
MYFSAPSTQQKLSMIKTSNLEVEIDVLTKQLKELTDLFAKGGDINSNIVTLANSLYTIMHSLINSDNEHIGNDLHELAKNSNRIANALEKLAMHYTGPPPSTPSYNPIHTFGPQTVCSTDPREIS